MSRAPEHAGRCRQCRVIEVVRLVLTRGDGDDTNPCREVVQWWLPDGSKMLAEEDPCPQVNVAVQVKP